MVSSIISNVIMMNVTTATSTKMTMAKCSATTFTSRLVSSDIANDDVSSTTIRTLYRDFIHIAKIQHKQQQQRNSSNKSKTTSESSLSSSSPSSLSNENAFLQEIRNEFRTNLKTNETIYKRYQYGLNRLSFIRMNTIQYKPRGYYTYNTNQSASSSSPTERQRFIYKNGQRYELNSLKPNDNENDSDNTSFTLRHDKGYTISPYTGSNLDPQNVTRHRQNLKRAGFINNSHAKGFF
jgi:hypothetical protein